MSKKSKTAIVTGASRGIGVALAKQLAADGFNVVVNYANRVDAAQLVVRDIVGEGGSAIAIQADVARAEEFKRLFDEAESVFGGVDVLVNNAGATMMCPLKDVTDADFQRIVSINLVGTFNGMREAANRLPDGGRIINLSTSVIGSYLPGASVYAATKSAVEALTHTLAKELGPRQVTVNAIAPGPTATELFYEGRSKEFIEQIVGGIPMGRIGEPEDIAGVVSFLAGPQSAWVSGQVIKVNGGRN
ncbi:SDR family oxidoreductase [Saccharospirillum mangrovi]|uniref:SDR family oxidoreductase n=1 Tax=Saccharospirillum mangrovi TaxID=2161747 RepID=UPI000D341A73|nr:SDR family oxidoreductase [Saccharospirillum mangrovi]